MVLASEVTSTSSKTRPGMFSGRLTSPTSGRPGMIIAAGPSLPANQVPEVSAMAPSA